MPNFIEIGGASRKFSKKLVDLTRNDPLAVLITGYGVVIKKIPAVKIFLPAVTLPSVLSAVCIAQN